MRWRLSAGMKCERAHVVQPVGELDQQHAHVVGDREQELAEILALRGPLRDEVERAILVRPSTSAPICGPKVVLISSSVASVSSIVSCRTRGGDRRVVELEVGQDRRDLERMGEIGIARGALLRAMGLHGVDIGAVEQVLVGVGL